MGQFFLNLFRMVLPLALEPTMAKSPFLYDILPGPGSVVHRPSSWNLHSPGPTAWDWNIQGTNGTTWRWEVPQGTWFTWFWNKDDLANTSGGGFRFWQMSNGEMWAELSWVRSGPNEVRWVCNLREPSSYDQETESSVVDLNTNTWKIRVGGHTWGFVRRKRIQWAFCTDVNCILINYEYCNKTITAALLSEDNTIEWADNNDVEEVESEPYRIVNVRQRRGASEDTDADADITNIFDLRRQRRGADDKEADKFDADTHKFEELRERRDMGKFFSDIVNTIANFFSSLFGGGDGRSEENPLLRIFGALVNLFLGGEEADTAEEGDSSSEVSSLVSKSDAEEIKATATR
nr:unnamed protein product [Timema bartmani]